MKRFLALLLLFCGAAQAQQIDYTYTQTYVGAPAPFQQLNVNQGNPLNLADDQVSNPINLGFNFTFYGQNFNSAFISSNGVLGFQGPINGCCSGYNLANPGNRYGIFALQTDLINLQTTNPWYRTQGEQGDRTFTVGWYNMPIFYDGNFRSSFEITLFESNNNILLNYGDLNTGGRFFTAGLKGNDGEYELLYSGTNDAFLENSSYMFSFIPPPPPIPEFLYWINLTSENGVFTLTTTGVVRYGASGTYAYAELQPGTYSCSNGFFGDPIPGVYKSCEFGSNNPPVVDCSTSPGDPSCLIDDGIIDYTDPEELLAALEDDNFTNTGDSGSDDGSDDGSDSGSNDGSEIDNTEDTTNSLEENLASVNEEAISEEESEDITESDAMEELIAEQELEELLSIEEMQDSIEEGDGEKEENEEKLADSIDPSILSLVLSIVESTSIVDNSGATAGAASSTTAAAAIGASGALNNTATVTTSSRTENTNNFSIDAANESFNEATQFAAAESQINANINAEINAALGLVTDSLRDAENLVASSASTEETVAANKTNESAFDDNTETDFPGMTLDPNNPLSQFFNNTPSLANLEAAGALNNRQDKSDAEVRAEQVVAANKEEQEAINANYMEADQSGIVAAIGADVDVSAYRTAMLNDNNIWYKPEDIYKGIIIKDNVRGSYFLEKGSTDTYKKMVEEQYK